ncbi:MAG: Spermidine/putrescine import ATP-binding protein PotA [Syntrophomonadaceae bacterium]|nr:Spermidine/putrescine import ATP-binding protein PotA [Bacillota bacterium]
MFLMSGTPAVCPLGNGPAYVRLDNVSKFFSSARAVFQLTVGIGKGEFFSLLGPSGCGKTTTLRLIAGLERPDQGAVSIGGEVVASADTWVSPEKRGIGIVFQDYALFPHMTVGQNVAFGLKGCGRAQAKSRVEELLELTGLAGLAGRYPHELSGGQRQRVALARSLAPRPSVILLDEPFSNLDADLREELRRETKRILKEQGATTILVTHDQEEAFSLSDRVGVLQGGTLEQLGSPAEIYHRPASRFVADFVGKADFIDGTVEDGTVRSTFGSFPLDDSAGIGTKQVELMVRPDDVSFVPDAAGQATVTEARFLGASVLYQLQFTDGRAIHSIRPSAEVTPVGSRVSVKVDASHIVIFPKDNA